MTEEAASSRDRLLTIPNALSILRLFLLPVVVWLLLGPEADGWAVALLMFLGITDYLDGYIARRWQQFSRVGEILDPAADRLYMLSVVVAFALRDFIPWWWAVLLLSRDVFLWALVPFLRTRGFIRLPVHFLGKAATAALLYGFPLLLLGETDVGISTAARIAGWAFAIWGTYMYWWAGILYAWQVRSLLREAPHLSGAT